MSREQIAQAMGRCSKEDLMDALMLAHSEVLELQHKIQEYQWLGDALRKRTAELSEKTKELECIYGISAVMKQRGCSTDQILNAVADRIPQVWQRPESTCAYIVINNRIFGTRRSKEIFYKLTAPVYAHGKCVGHIEIRLMTDLPHQHQQMPFIREERELLDTIAVWVGQVVESKGDPFN